MPQELSKNMLTDLEPWSTNLELLKTMKTNQEGHSGEYGNKRHLGTWKN